MALPTTKPSLVGVDAQGVLDLLDAAAHLELHSIALARDGQCFARGWWAPYGPDRRHLLYSVSKSITATTVAALVGEGLLGLDDPVLDHLPLAAIPAGVADVWRRVTVRHCLTMTVGHTSDAWPPRQALAAEPLHTILDNPPDAEPGSVFTYNQVATYLLSRAVEHVAGRPLDEVAMERVLGPLGVPRLDWERDAAGHPFGFSGARLRTDDLLSLAQLWLDRGAAGDRQLVPPSWVDDAARPFLPVPAGSASDWEQGYGQSFWIARHGFRADGAYGQFGIVLPEQRVVVAITSEVAEMQEPLDLLWQHLLPAIDRPGSAEADARLEDRLAGLALPVLSSSSGPAGQRDWAVDPSSDLTSRITAVHVDAEGSTLTLVRDGEPLAIDVGDGAWVDSVLHAEGVRLPVTASGGWTDGGYRAEVRLIETPHSFTVETGHSAAVLRWRHRPLRSDDPLTCGLP